MSCLSYALRLQSPGSPQRVSLELHLRIWACTPRLTWSWCGGKGSLSLLAIMLHVGTHSWTPWEETQATCVWVPGTVDTPHLPELADA